MFCTIEQLNYLAIKSPINILTLHFSGKYFSLKSSTDRAIIIGVELSQNIEHPVKLDQEFSFLSPKEKMILNKFSTPRRKIEWFLGRILVKLAIQELVFVKIGFNVNLNSIIIHQTKNEKPICSIIGLNKNLNIDFSISHSKNLFVVGASFSKIGVDIERIQALSNHLIVKNFNSDELELFNLFRTLLDSNVSKNQFLTLLWSCKESIAKNLGLGLKIGLQNLKIEIRNTNLFVKFNTNYYPLEFFLTKDYVITTSIS